MNVKFHCKWKSSVLALLLRGSSGMVNGFGWSWTVVLVRLLKYAPQSCWILADIVL